MINILKMRKMYKYDEFNIILICVIILLSTYILLLGDFKITLKRRVYTYEIEFNGVLWWLLDSYSNLKFENKDPLSILSFNKIENESQIKDILK